MEQPEDSPRDLAALVVSRVGHMGGRQHQHYLPAGSRGRDAWRPDSVHDGGQTIMVAAEAHQLPLFVRVGSSVTVGDLAREWQESRAIARTKPNLAALERSVNEWFKK